MKNIKIAFLFFLFIWGSCHSYQKLATNQAHSSFIRYDNPNIKYNGRVGFPTDSTCAAIYWSGSSIRIDFEGTEIKVVLQDENYKNYFNVILDGEVIKMIRPDTIKTIYTLAENLSQGKHSIELFKRTEWTNGKTWFYGFQTNPTGKILPLKAANKRMIEFYGNSITCGYAVEDYSGNDSPDSIYTNNYVAYGALTARHFNADYTCIARSGIGLTISWFDQVIQDIYGRLDPSDAQSKWDFSSETPNIVVVNLLQNDSWLTNRPEHPEFKRRFGEHKPSPEKIIAVYADFIARLRHHYPSTSIICMLGNMDATKNGVWSGYIETAVETLNDKHIYTLFIPYKNTLGHPKVAEQKIIADTLIHFIEKELSNFENKE